MRIQRTSALRGSNGLWMVHRPRLMNRLDEAVQRQVTLVVAPLGYGKSTALTQWIEGRRDRIVRLDATGLTPRDVRASIGGSHGAAQIVVVDDVHRASADALDALFDLLDSDTRLVLSGISRPNVPIGGLTARGQVTELVAGDLTFDREEARVLLEAVAPVPDAALDIVMDTSLGWPAALRILSEQELSWERARSQLTRLYAFFDEEVHPLAAPAERALLRTLSILPTLTPAATAALTGDRDAHLALSALADRGFPIIRTDGGLSIHPLIRRQLVEEFVAAEPERYRTLAAAGIDWLADHGDTLAAIRLALEVAAPLDAGPLLRRHFLNFLFTERVRLREAVEACAAAGHLEPWEGPLLHSALLTAGGEVSAPIALETIAGMVDEEALDEFDRLRLAGFRLFIARHQAYQGVDLSSAVAVADWTQELEAPQRDALPHLAFLQVERGLHLMYEGDLDVAQEWLVRGLTTARLAALPPVAAQALSGRAWIAARRGSVAAARRIADEAIMEATALVVDENTCLPELAFLAKAMIDIDLSNLEQAEALLAAQRRCCVTPRRETAVLVAQLEAMRQIMRGDTAGAVEIIERAWQTTGPMLPMEQYMLAATASGALLISDDDRDAAMRWIQICEGVARPEFGGSAHLRAHHMMRLGQFDEAYEMLEPIVRDADVVVEKEWLQMLMAYALAADRSGRTAVAVATFTAADELASRIGMDSPRARQNLGTVERRAKVQFTEAERHLLRNLTADESIRELAERLFVSPNTVKTHLRRIYGKLAVSSREEAIERATVLRLL